MEGKLEGDNSDEPRELDISDRCDDQWKSSKI